MNFEYICGNCVLVKKIRFIFVVYANCNRIIWLLLAISDTTFTNLHFYVFNDFMISKKLSILSRCVSASTNNFISVSNCPFIDLQHVCITIVQ